MSDFSSFAPKDEYVWCRKDENRGGSKRGLAHAWHQGVQRFDEGVGVLKRALCGHFIPQVQGVFEGARKAFQSQSDFDFDSG